MGRLLVTQAETAEKTPPAAISGNQTSLTETPDDASNCKPALVMCLLSKGLFPSTLEWTNLCFGARKAYRSRVIVETADEDGMVSETVEARRDFGDA
jgi:hypothetical protein